MAELAKVSNPYLSQIERGLHEPSVRVLRSIAAALNISAETLLAQAGVIDAVTGDAPPAAAATDAAAAGNAGAAPAGSPTTEAAIRLDPALTEAQKEALLGVYRSFLK